MFFCEQCDYKNKDKFKLKRHFSAVHEKKKPFACLDCNFKCSRKDHLEKHISVVHEKKKPFACFDCNFKFSRKDHLEKHISAVHKKEKPFACPECNFKCSQTNHLKRHIKYKHTNMTTREVDPGAYCEHNRYRQSCKECNPVGHQRQLIRVSILRGLRSLGVSKDKHSEEILGCTFEELHSYLQAKVDHWNQTYGFISSKFMDGELQLDHIKPLSLAKTKEEVEALNHYTNLQLIWKHVNTFKSNRWDEVDEKHWQENIYRNLDHKNIYIPEICWAEVFK